MKHYITTPINDYDLTKVKAGDTVILSGKILTGRDAAHKRLIELLDKDGYLPINIKNQAIYYTGPCPNKTGGSNRLMWSYHQLSHGLDDTASTGFRTKNNDR